MKWDDEIVGRSWAKEGEPHSLRQALAHDEVVAKRGTPSMPKLEFMNGTKWGKVVDEPDSRAA